MHSRCCRGDATRRRGDANNDGDYLVGGNPTSDANNDGDY
jgi:hypothetical protein